MQFIKKLEHIKTNFETGDKNKYVSQTENSTLHFAVQNLVLFNDFRSTFAVIHKYGFIVENITLHFAYLSKQTLCFTTIQ